MGTNALYIVIVYIIAACILVVLINNNRTIYFNTNRFKAGSKSEIVPIEFHVIKIEESETQYDKLCISKKFWKYTVVNHFFFKKDTRFIHKEYVFWDEPEKYKVGDVLTLSNVK